MTGHELRFGAFITPTAADAHRVVELAVIAEEVGLDLVTFQDHPYQARFLDTWTLLSFVAGCTSRVRLAPNVANLPLRPPPSLARSVASLDLLSGGRAELGLGAGALWDAVAANGGPRRSPGQSVEALDEAVDAIREFWRPGGRPIHFGGVHYSYRGAKAGPAPAHPAEIWLGALKPRMLALTGRKADGWLPSSSFVPPDQLAERIRHIEQGAASAGRDPGAVRRLYNLTGRFGQGGGFLQGRPSDWAEQLVELAHLHRISSFILAGDDEDDLRRFAADVAPAVRESLASASGGGQESPPP